MTSGQIDLGLGIKTYPIIAEACNVMHTAHMILHSIDLGLINHFELVGRLLRLILSSTDFGFCHLYRNSIQVIRLNVVV